MTNKQYEHIGRAVCIEAQLEEAHEALDELRCELEKELSYVAPSDSVNKFVVESYGRCFATWHNPSRFMEAIRSIIKRETKNENSV